MVEYSKFQEELLGKYLPPKFDGDNFAMQAVTAFNRLDYKWYQNGDIYDNTNHMFYYGTECNNVAPAANWLYNHIPDTREILLRIRNISSDREYDQIIEDLADIVLVEDKLLEWEKQPKESDIYNEKSPFEIRDDLLEEDEDEYDDEY